MNSYDVVIVGGGPAGLSAAIVLGRCRRQVLLCDSGEYRNACSDTMHAFIGREGTAPASLRATAREEIAQYSSVGIADVRVTSASRVPAGFDVELADGATVRSRTLLLATGVEDELPPLPGASEFYGNSMFHCPYCDGWEHRDEPIAVYGRGRRGLELALELTVWSDDLVLCTDGSAELDDRARDQLVRNAISLDERRIAELCGQGAQLTGVRFTDGALLPRSTMFFVTEQRERSGLPASLGCAVDVDGTVETEDNESTNVPGLFVAGDVSRQAQLVIVAAAEGAQAGAAINAALLQQDLR